MKCGIWILSVGLLCVVGCDGKDDGRKKGQSYLGDGSDTQSESWKNTHGGISGKKSKPQPVTILTYDVLPPYAFRDEKGNLTGVYIEIAKTAFSRMTEYNISLVTVPWARAKREVEKGRAFAILPPYFHAHDWLTQALPHRPYIWPYSMSLYTQQDVIICRADVLQKPRPSYPDDYRGLDFVMWRGDGRAGAEFNRMTKGREITLHSVENVENTVKFLLLERADCTITSKATFYWYLEKLTKSDKYKQHTQNVSLKEAMTISTNKGYLGYTDIDAEKNYPFKKDFAIKFDIEIYKMKKSGELEEIVNKFVKRRE